MLPVITGFLSGSTRAQGYHTLFPSKLTLAEWAWDHVEKDRWVRGCL